MTRILTRIKRSFDLGHSKCPIVRHEADLSYVRCDDYIPKEPDRGVTSFFFSLPDLVCPTKSSGFVGFTVSTAHVRSPIPACEHACTRIPPESEFTPDGVVRNPRLMYERMCSIAYTYANSCIRERE